MTHVLRVPRLDLASILAQQNPQLDLRLDAYETSTRNFLAAVAAYTQRAVGEISARKSAFAVQKKRVADKAQLLDAEIAQCKVREIELASALQKEQEERKEAEAGVATFRRELASVKEKCASLDVEIEQHRAATSVLTRERRREQAILATHASRTLPEVAAYEDRLKCWIEGVDKDKILIRFTHLDPSDLHREFSLVIDVSSWSYKVPTTTPFLPTLPFLLDGLNESRDLYAFVRRVREAFRELALQGR